MAEMTARTARAQLKPFEEGLAALVRILDVAARAEAAEGQALSRTQDAERRIAQAALRAEKAEQEYEQVIRNGQERVQKAEQGLQERLRETKQALEGQLAVLSDEVQSERRRLDQAVQDRQQAERDRDAARNAAKDLTALRAEIQRTADERARLEAEIGALNARLEGRRAAYEEITQRIGALKG